MHVLRLRVLFGQANKSDNRINAYLRVPDSVMVYEIKVRLTVGMKKRREENFKGFESRSKD